MDAEEEDGAKKLKVVKGHALVQRIESRCRKNVWFYEITNSLGAHFEAKLCKTGSRPTLPRATTRCYLGNDMSRKKVALEILAQELLVSVK